MEQQKYNQQLTELLGLQKNLVAELLQLSQRENRECEANRIGELAEITAQRTEVLNTLLAAQTRTADLIERERAHHWPVPAEAKELALTAGQMIASIQELDNRSQHLLGKMMSQQMTDLRQMDNGARLLRSYQTEAKSVAYSSRE